MTNQPSKVDAILETMSEDIYQRFRTAIETGKWPNGQSLTQEQRQTCMEAVIVYEHANLAEQERTGFVPPKKSACESNGEKTDKKAGDENPLVWKDQ